MYVKTQSFLQIYYKHISNFDRWRCAFCVTTRAAGVEPAYQPKKEWASRLGLCSTVELHSHNPYPKLWSVEGIWLVIYSDVIIRTIAIITIKSIC